MDYKKAYFLLFNTITDVIENIDNGLQNIDSVVDKLKSAQIKTEEMYIEDV